MNHLKHPAHLELSNLTKSWGDTTAVNQVNLSVTGGSFTVLLGPSGCGKSTTLRLIAGLEEATSGQISIGGRDVTHRSPAQRDISMVFQNYALFPHISVAENILFGLKVRKVGRAERDGRLKHAADLLGISHLLERKPSQLSGGQQQRVALGRAIVSQKPVCLMDEPLSNLDAKLRQEMRVELRALQQQLGLTMVYVTHDQTEAITMADQVVLMNNGQVEQAASPKEIYERPASVFTARFIGTPPMNIVSLDAIRSVTPLTVQHLLPKTSVGSRLGLRPEDIRLTGENGIPGQVLSLEYMGADTLANCSVGGEKMLVRVKGTTELKPGQTVGLTWDAEIPATFHGDTGKRREEIKPAEVQFEPA
ncbi:sn-glycerol-3-phosphate import ATP-binding protein UgpC [Pseudovibrio axinellae]|uniref:sn-glycerol-3-phosphate import ATP-binding protein UgpC n=1 Tax=Pseudovibrio axinellae TaxID=989403 RepID=A0A165Z701_9HYPH|nr:ABC transporter ATP-binding protein [Pseudovibrio axinellae]KZL19565.1 sn-glycerol-3-phosphate import ATP-binding protein UgpC [Pseudovibrio axinellae]SEQ32242.1 carbohydrate ABC transporter ATP-binding protein, CUT1 family [Pseudovibrio axinellae]